MYIKIMTLICLAITIFLCNEEYKNGKMTVRNFKIVCVCEGIAFMGMVYQILTELQQEVPHYEGYRIELLGIGVILLGIALSTNIFGAYTLGVIGFGIISIGCFWKDKNK